MKANCHMSELEALNVEFYSTHCSECETPIKTGVYTCKACLDAIMAYQSNLPREAYTVDAPAEKITVWTTPKKTARYRDHAQTSDISTRYADSVAAFSSLEHAETLSTTLWNDQIIFQAGVGRKVEQHEEKGIIGLMFEPPIIGQSFRIKYGKNKGFFGKVIEVVSARTVKAVVAETRGSVNAWKPEASVSLKKLVSVQLLKIKATTLERDACPFQIVDHGDNIDPLDMPMPWRWAHPEHREDEERYPDETFDRNPDLCLPSPQDRKDFDVWGLQESANYYSSAPHGFKPPKRTYSKTLERIDFEELYKLGGVVIGRHDAVVDLPYYLTVDYAIKRLKCSATEAKQLIKSFRVLQLGKTEVLVTYSQVKGRKIDEVISEYQALADAATNANDHLRSTQEDTEQLETARALHAKNAWLVGKPLSGITEEVYEQSRRELSRLESAAIGRRLRPGYVDMDCESRTYPSSYDAMEHINTDGLAHNRPDFGGYDTDPAREILALDGLPSAAEIAHKGNITLERAGEVREAMYYDDMSKASAIFVSAVEEEDEEDFDLEPSDKDEDNVPFVSEGYHPMPPLAVPDWRENQPDNIIELFEIAEHAENLETLGLLGKAVFQMELNPGQRAAFWAVYNARKDAIVLQAANRIKLVRNSVKKLFSLSGKELAIASKKLHSLPRNAFPSPEAWQAVWSAYHSRKALTTAPKATYATMQEKLACHSHNKEVLPMAAEEGAEYISDDSIYCESDEYAALMQARQRAYEEEMDEQYYHEQ